MPYTLKSYEMPSILKWYDKRRHKKTCLRFYYVIIK